MQRVTTIADLPSYRVPRAARRHSPRVLNLHFPELLPSEIEPRLVARAFYALFRDDYDFLAIVSVPDHNANRRFISVKNDVRGIGPSLSDRTDELGSAGRLQGVVRYPILSYFDLGETGANHGIGHRWMNHLPVDGLREGVPHWPLSSLGRGVMAVRGVGSLSLHLPARRSIISRASAEAPSAGPDRPVRRAQPMCGSAWRAGRRFSAKRALRPIRLTPGTTRSG